MFSEKERQEYMSKLLTGHEERMLLKKLEQSGSIIITDNLRNTIKNTVLDTEPEAQDDFRETIRQNAFERREQSMREFIERQTNPRPASDKLLPWEERTASAAAEINRKAEESKKRRREKDAQTEQD